MENIGKSQSFDLESNLPNGRGLKRQSPQTLPILNEADDEPAKRSCTTPPDDLWRNDQSSGPLVDTEATRQAHQPWTEGEFEKFTQVHYLLPIKYHLVFDILFWTFRR
jgi:hypothetical protein